MNQNEEIKFRGQVVTETDAMNAVYTYLATQLDGWVRIEFPDHTSVIDDLVRDLRDDCCRNDPDGMKYALNGLTGEFAHILTGCMINGCDDEGNHRFMRSLINLVWDSRNQTAEWLKGQGIVPGQSAN